MLSPDLSSFQSDPLAKPILAHMTAGKWRKARDAARDLIRKDRPKYLPLLVAANIGLAGDLLTRRLDQDAATVIDYLKTIAPPEMLAGLQARQLQNKSAALLIKGSPEEILATAWSVISRIGADFADKAVRDAADRLVAATTEIPPGIDAPELRAELAAARAAVHATARGAWDEARAALRSVSAKSIFGSWRLFLRGVRCVHAGEMDTARQCFETLPTGSATARAAWAYRTVCGLPTGPDVPPLTARNAFSAALCGASPKAAAAVAEAENLWRKHDLPAACQALTNGMEDFPSENPGLGETLTSLFFFSAFPHSRLSLDAIDDYAAWLQRRLKHGNIRKLAPLEEKLTRLQLLRMEASVMDPDETSAHATRIIEIHTRQHGADPLHAAAVWQLVADSIPDKAADESVFALPDFGPPPAELRTDALRHCVEHDPDHPARILALADNLAANRKYGEMDALLARSVARLPDHPGLLTAAGVSALRENRPEAISWLRQAVKLDPSIRQASNTLATALHVQISRKKNFDSALWDELESLGLPTPTILPDSVKTLGLERQKWFLRLCRAQADPTPAPTPRTIPPGTDAPSPFVENLATALIRTLEGCPSLPIDLPASWQDLCWALHLLRRTFMCRPDRDWLAPFEDFLMERAQPLLTLQSLTLSEGAKGSLAFARAADAILADEELPPQSARLPLHLILRVASALDDPRVRSRHYEAHLASILLPVHCREEWLPCFCPLLAEIGGAAKLQGDQATASLANKLITRCGDIPAPPWTRLPKAKTTKKSKTAKKSPAKKRSGSTPAPDSSPKPPAGYPFEDQLELFALPPDLSELSPQTRKILSSPPFGLPTIQSLARSMAAMEIMDRKKELAELRKDLARPTLSMPRESMDALLLLGRILIRGSTPEQLLEYIATTMG